MAGRPRTDGGVTMAPGAGRRKSIAMLAAALALVCIAVLVLFDSPPPPPSAAEVEPAPAIAAADAPGEPRRPAVSAPAPEPDRAAAPEPTPEVEAGPGPAVGVEGGAESEPAPSGGIGLFPPPGTDPIKVGIVVPDEFELPEGYLRHYQVTDDGQEVEPILLLHPDYELLDDAGNPIPRPADGIVPPELAPPGLPVEMLEVPPPLETGS